VELNAWQIGPYIFVQTCDSLLDPKTLYFYKVFGWTVAFFFNLVDIAAYNALALWITMNPNCHRGNSHAKRLFQCFCVNLAWVWQMNVLQNVSLITLANDDASKHALVIVAFLPIDHHWHHQTAAATGVRRRCNAWPHQLERKTTRSWHTCGVSICKQHSTVLMTGLECADGGGPSTALWAAASDDGSSCWETELTSRFMAKQCLYILLNNCHLSFHF